MPKAPREPTKGNNPNRRPAKSATCPICGITLSRDFDLIRHIKKKHYDECDHVCRVPKCTFRTNQSSNLATHLRTHTGKKPYKCPRCSFQCSDQSNLIRHTNRKNHDSLKPQKKKSRKLTEEEVRIASEHLEELEAKGRGRPAKETLDTPLPVPTPVASTSVQAYEEQYYAATDVAYYSNYAPAPVAFTSTQAYEQLFTTSPDGQYIAAPNLFQPWPPAPYHGNANTAYPLAAADPTVYLQQPMECIDPRLLALDMADLH